MHWPNLTATQTHASCWLTTDCAICGSPVISARGTLTTSWIRCGAIIRSRPFVPLGAASCCGHRPGVPEMPAPPGAPEWAADLYTAFESGASGQFILYGNVHDRLAAGDHLVNIEYYIENELLAGFQVLFCYDLGNGLTVQRGSERLAEWVPAVMQSLPRDPLAAIRFVSRFGRYLGNLEAIGRPNNVQVAVLVRGAEQLLPADGRGFEHGSLTSLVREWGSGSPFTELPFVSLLIADTLNDLEPLIAFGPQSTRVRIPLPSMSELQSVLALLQRQFKQTIPATTDLAMLAAAMTGVSVS